MATNVRCSQKTPEEFGKAIRSFEPGCRCTPGALADWHRRIGLSLLPSLGYRIGTERARAFLLAAGL